jgi:DNA-binding CsgD family transcriptional regulator/PAS domain-containing protein
VARSKARPGRGGAAQSELTFGAYAHHYPARIEHTSDAINGIGGLSRDMDLSLALRDELQNVVADQTAWPRLLERLADLLGATEATFGGGTQWEAPRIYAPRTDPGFVGIYLETFHEHNGFMQTLAQSSVGRVVSANAMPGFANLLRTDFYNLWCVPQGFHHNFSFSIAAIGGWGGTMSISQPGEPTPEQMKLLSSLMPHVQRAVETHLMLEQLRSSQTSTLSVLNLAGNGALLLDRHGRVMEANPIAESLLSSGQLILRDGQVHAIDADSDTALTRLVTQCLHYPDRAGRGEIAIGPLKVQCAPFAGSVVFPLPQRPAAIVIISDTQQQLRQRLEEVQRLYGLTQAEVELAQAVVLAGSRKIAAEMRGVTDATARAQLSSIFDKIGVRRQTDLVRLLMGGQ